MCVMEELNKATFAQVPLKYTGEPLKPAAADTTDTEDYRVGVSPLWRTGKRTLGIYPPWRFGSPEFRPARRANPISDSENRNGRWDPHGQTQGHV